jgi:topoisomerase (DNA) II binding protein 1
LQDDPVCVATRKDGKKVVTENWVEDSFELGELIDAERASLASLPAFYTTALSLNKIHERLVSFV